MKHDPLKGPAQQERDSYESSEIVLRAVQAAYGQPVVNNVWRGQLVEAMIATALEPEWQWCGAD
jgi:hypothetical protein